MHLFGCVGKRQAFFALVMALLLGGGGTAARSGQPPTLAPSDHLSHVYAVGDTVAFRFQYNDAEGDTPLEAGVVLTSPSGGKVTRKVESSELAAIHNGGIVTVTYQPSESGIWQYHFYARDADGTASFPERAELSFKVQPNWLPWALMIGGLVISLGVITTLMYQLMHRLAGATPTSAARVALMVGVICAVVSVLYAWDWLSQPLAWLAGGLVIILLAVWALVSR